MLKRCTRCKKNKSVSEFHKCAEAPDGLQYRCKACSRVATSLSIAKNPQKDIIRKKQWYQENKTKILAHYATKTTERHAAAKRWALNNPVKKREQDKAAKSRRCVEAVAFERFSRRLRDRSLTLDQYHSLAEKQDFLCAVCGSEPVVKSRSSIDGFVVDHDHVTNRVRSLLCPNCNVALGMLRDNPEIARKAASYLDHHNHSRSFLVA